jgi:hypothetical protein
MLMQTLWTTLAFAPAPEDLEDIDFHPPVIMSTPPAPVEEESEPGEP